MSALAEWEYLCAHYETAHETESLQRLLVRLKTALGVEQNPHVIRHLHGVVAALGSRLLYPGVATDCFARIARTCGSNSSCWSTVASLTELVPIVWVNQYSSVKGFPESSSLYDIRR